MATLCPHCGKDIAMQAANGNSLPTQPEDKPYSNAAPKSDAIKHLYSMIMSGKATEIKDFAKGIKISNKLMGTPNEQ